MQYAQERVTEGSRLRFKECKWPPPVYAQADGYSDVVVTNVVGPGTDEASGASEADRIVTGCAKVQLAYSYQNMGVDQPNAPITLSSGDIVTIEGNPWVKDSPAPLPFYPNRGEMDVIRNGRYRLDSAVCLA